MTSGSSGRAASAGERGRPAAGWEILGEVCAAHCGPHDAVDGTGYITQAAVLAELL